MFCRELHTAKLHGAGKCDFEFGIRHQGVLKVLPSLAIPLQQQYVSVVANSITNVRNVVFESTLNLLNDFYD
jgi:hypothetical protein